jgi:hypothetical protein
MRSSLLSLAKTSLFATSIAAAVVLAGPAARAVVLYNQPSTFPATEFDASQIDTNPGGLGAFTTDYDDFTLPTTDSINAIAWSGEDFNPSTHATISAFTISFYANNSGVPGTMLYTETIPGDANETSLGTSDNNNPSFNYFTDLNTPFMATSGTPYWLSIVANAPLFPQWSWESGSGGNGTSYQIFEGTNFPRQTDDAFTLSGTVAPEPSTVSVLFAGVLGLSLMTLKKRRALRS